MHTVFTLNLTLLITLTIQKYLNVQYVRNLKWVQRELYKLIHTNIIQNVYIPWHF